MNSRERVLKAFKRIPGLPDRVPIQFDLCRQLSDHFGKEMGIPVKYTENPYEDVTYRISTNELRLALGSDVVITGASVSDDYRIVKEADGTWLNEYQMRMRQGDIYVEVVKYPLAHAETKTDIDNFRFPDPNAPGRFRDAEELIAKYKNEYFIIGDIEVTVFSLAHQLAGMEKLLIDMMLETEYVVPLFEACADYQTKIGLELIKRGVDAIWFGDDFGTQSSLIIPQETFRQQLKPVYKKMIERFKHANPEIVPILHCDGAVADLLDDIREIGFEVFNPVQPGVPGHLPQDMKDRFGDKFAFWGAVDQQDLLPNGTDEELEKDIREKISILGRDGGYMISPAHILQNDVSPERVMKFIELCMKYGKYKLAEKKKILTKGYRSSGMLLVTLVMMLCAMYSRLAGAQNPVRPDAVSLAGEWRFSLDASDEGIRDAWQARTLKESIYLPGILQSQGYGNLITKNTPWVSHLYDPKWYERTTFKPFAELAQVGNPYFPEPPRHYLGAAWYQRDIVIPAPWADKQVSLILERPHWRSEVWLDGRAIGFNESLSTAHVYLLGRVSPGKHVLTIRVDNRRIIPVGVDSHSISDQLGATWNGIVGRIEMVARSEVRLDNVQVYPDMVEKKIRINAEVINATGFAGHGSLKVEAILRGSKASTVSRIFEVEWTPEGSNIDIEMLLGEKARLWDEFNPNLYDLKLELKTPGISVDKQVVSFGLREFKANGTRFSINGRNFSWRSTHFGGDFALTGYPAMDVASWKDIFTVCKQYGINAMRFHSWCPPEAAFTAADEMGFYLQPEPGNWSEYVPGSSNEKFLYEETDRILSAYGNHPSFVMMSMGNEPWGVEKTKVIFPWVESCQKKDQRHLYSAKSGIDVFSGDPSDYMSLMFGNGRTLMRGPEGWFGKDYRKGIAEVQVPVVTHEVGEWFALPDFDALIASMNGYLHPGNIKLFREIWQSKGMLGENKKFSDASGRFQTLCYKEEIEANRRTPGIGGFTLLDLRDYIGQGTSLVGVVDPLWNPKSYVTSDEFRRFCGVTVPLARMTQQVYRTSEKLSIDVEIAHDGPTALTGVKPYWKVINTAGEVLSKGTFPFHEIPSGRNTSLGTIVADLKAWPAPAHYKLVVGMDQTEVENDWDFWLYPDELTTSVGDEVLVTNDFDEAEIRLAAGGKVFYLPLMSDLEWGSPATRARPVFWNELLACQWARFLGISCNPEHPALKLFPTDNHFNWQWSEIVDPGRSRGMRVTGFDTRLKPVISVIDQIAHGEKLALVFECKVGSGQLLVCSADLNYQIQNRVVARQLRHSLLSYVKSKDFNPSVEVTVDELRSLLLDNLVMKKLGAQVKADSPMSQRPEATIDGDPNTFWQAGAGETEKQPRWLEVEFPQPVDIEGVVYLPRQNHYLMEGCIREYRIDVSQDGTTWTTVSQGEWPLSYDARTIRFERKVTVQKIKLTALTWVGDAKNVSVAELTVLYSGPKLPPAIDGKVQYQKVRTSTEQVVEPE